MAIESFIRGIRAEHTRAPEAYTHHLPPGTTIYTANREDDTRCQIVTKGPCAVDIRGADRRHRRLVPALVREIEPVDSMNLYVGRSVWIRQGLLNRLHRERTVPPSQPDAGHESQPAVNFTPLASEPELVQGALDGLPTTPTPTDSYFKHGL